ncbi:TPA: hypothetical protein I7114_09415 [Vibrio vulnificus]|nr:hypothetical protein [Vibrio vulnificus]HAS6389034.1 hypothetical protein [Vibrio vulnificus]HAS6422149.1 hypothetical protein [Vibrio vulnificus]HAT8556398.1 hypothetical protein [Vibrio vulnificus]HAU8251731.1 hypothetical protein [Vibrio vulnificus]
MRVLVCSTVLLVVLMVPSAMANYKNHTFQVSTTIDRSSMLADTARLKLEPNSLTLSYDPTINTFANKPVKLTIESDVYSFDSQLAVSGYQLFLINNVSSCYSSQRAETENKLDGYDSIVNIHIDNKVESMMLDAANTYSNTKFDSASSVLSHDLMLKFKTIGDVNVKSCNGSFAMGFRYDL